MSKKLTQSMARKAFRGLLALPAATFGRLLSEFAGRVDSGTWSSAVDWAQTQPQGLFALAGVLALGSYESWTETEGKAKERRVSEASVSRLKRIATKVNELADQGRSTQELLQLLVSAEREAASSTIDKEYLDESLAELRAGEAERSEALGARLEASFGVRFDRLERLLESERNERSRPAATLEKYLRDLAAEMRKHLLERFRFGDRHTDDADIEKRLLGQIYVELDAEVRSADRCGSRDAAWRLEQLLDGGLGSQSGAVLWDPPGFGLLEQSLGNPQARPTSLRTVAWISTNRDGAQSFFVESRKDSAGPELEGECELLRQSFPSARIIGVLRTADIPLHHLIALDPELHRLEGRYVMRGHPGTGKTTVLRHTALVTATRALDADCSASTPIPVVVYLPTWAKSQCPLPQFLGKRHAAFATDDRLVRRLASKGAGLVVLFDGLDEVQGDEPREWVQTELGNLAEAWPEARMVVATRKIGFDRLALIDFAEVDLKPLDSQRQENLLRGWLASSKRVRDPEALVGRIIKDLDLGGPAFLELREVPLLLTFVAMLYEDHEQDPAFRIAKSRVALYSGILEHLRQGRHRKPSRSMQPPLGSHHALQLLAERCTTQTGEEPTRAELIADLNEWWDGKALRDVRNHWRKDGRPDVDGFLRALSETTGILGGPDRDEAIWAFWHRTLREALVAKKLAADVEQKDGHERVLALARNLEGKESQWAEPFALFVGMAPKDQRDEWILLLAAQNQPLALRALASVDGVAVETIKQVLQLEGLEAEERCRQYGLVLERLGANPDVIVAAKLLGDLAAGTDDCMDLWHIARALDRLEHDEPGARREVTRQRKRLFEHDTFRSDRPDVDALQVPGHPKHPYWCKVGANTAFRMGSRDGEEGREDYEGPVRDVLIEAAYEIAAVPVTNALWARFRKDFDREKVDRRPDDPVTGISWFDASMFCEWLGVRLPSEAEWECACRAGTQTRFWLGDSEEDLARVGWYSANAERTIHQVAAKPHNEWGLFDVHGNVWEWCEDRWHQNYEGAPKDGTAWEAGGSGSRVGRGGGFGYTAVFARSAYRDWWPPVFRGVDLGFRPARPRP